MALAQVVTDEARLTLDEVKQRVDDLRQLHAPYIHDRARIRAIMDGGMEGVRMLLGDNIDIGDERTSRQPI